MVWKPEAFERATTFGPEPVAGYVYRGLGIYQWMQASPKGRRPAEWRLIHLGTGHSLALLKGSVAVAFSVATEIAEAGDWDFLSMEGWKDRFPDARERLLEIIERHPKIAVAKIGGNGNREVAQAIAANRP